MPTRSKNTDLAAHRTLSISSRSLRERVPTHRTCTARAHAHHALTSRSHRTRARSAHFCAAQRALYTRSPRTRAHRSLSSLMLHLPQLSSRITSHISPALFASLNPASSPTTHSMQAVPTLLTYSTNISSLFFPSLYTPTAAISFTPPPPTLALLHLLTPRISYSH